MNKKLPNVFANKIDKNVNNNEKVFYSKLDEKKTIKKEEKSETKVKDLGSNLNINQKINKIFNSTKYVYKADVHISLKDEQMDCRIIGRNSTHLITIDNKLIPISDIIDISFIEK